MTTGRLEAFSDAVIAILITILVLELEVPHEPELAALGDLVPVFSSYVLSFVYLGIYWNNHHHMMVLTERVNGRILWANLHLLFWLSLVPFTTAWMGQNDFAGVPTAVYGVDLLLAAVAYFILQRSIIVEEGANSTLAAALGRDLKGKISPVLYVIGVSLSFAVPLAGLAIYVLVALLWLVPDRRIESSIA